MSYPQSIPQSSIWDRKIWAIVNQLSVGITFYPHMTKKQENNKKTGIIPHNKHTANSNRQTRWHHFQNQPCLKPPIFIWIIAREHPRGLFQKFSTTTVSQQSVHQQKISTVIIFEMKFSRKLKITITLAALKSHFLVDHFQNLIDLKSTEYFKIQNWSELNLK